MRGGSLLVCGARIARAVLVAGVSVPPPGECARVPPGAVRHSHSLRASGRELLASFCGFAKDMVNGPSAVLDAGVFGDDACFIASYKSTHVIGVADGVGGWRRYGIDPSEFSRRLMRSCAELVHTGQFEPSRPDRLLAAAFTAISRPPHPPIGSSTACVLTLHQDTLYTANLGDSGFLVLRAGSVLHRSREQTHYFNAPFQLALPPANMAVSGFLGDSPDAADLFPISVQPGDLVVLATDGLWDNVSETTIIELLAKVDAGDIQTACNALALTARRLAFDSRHVSPFALKASEHGIDAPGGKPDDITLILMLVS